MKATDMKPGVFFKRKGSPIVYMHVVRPDVQDLFNTVYGVSRAGVLIAFTPFDEEVEESDMGRWAASSRHGVP